ncbi:hypothetical protein Dimus_025285 [Dionaea muscipula]
MSQNCERRNGHLFPVELRCRCCAPSPVGVWFTTVEVSLRSGTKAKAMSLALGASTTSESPEHGRIPARAHPRGPTSTDGSQIRHRWQASQAMAGTLTPLLLLPLAATAASNRHHACGSGVWVWVACGVWRVACG